MEDQDELLIRKSEYEEVDLETNNKAVLEDVRQTQICISPIKRTTRKIRRLASAEPWTTSNDEVVGRLTS